MIGRLTASGGQDLFGRVVLVSVVSAATTIACSVTGKDPGSGEVVVQPSEVITTPAPESTLVPTTDTIPVDAVALPDVRIDLVQFGEDGFVRITNNGESDASIEGVWLCQHAVHVDLSTVLNASRIPVGGSVQIPSVTLGGIAIDGGEAALYGAAGCDDPAAVFGFVQWGTGGLRHSDAADAGLWPMGATVTADPAYGNIELYGDPASPESWS